MRGGSIKHARRWHGAQRAGHFLGVPSRPELATSWECRAAQSRQARPEEAQEPSSGTARGRRLSTPELPELRRGGGRGSRPALRLEILGRL